MRAANPEKNPNASEMLAPLPKLVLELAPPPEEVNDGRKMMLPLRLCPHRCFDRGACYAPGTCVCRKGFKGYSCELQSRDEPVNGDDRGWRSCPQK